MSLAAQPESQIEVHKFYGGAILVASILSVAFEGVVHRFGTWGQAVELPLLVTVYFGLSRRNPATGLLLGTFIGMLQDAVSHQPLGLYGIAKTIVGFLASSIGGRIDIEHPVSRTILVFVFFHIHQGVWALSQKWLMGRPEPVFTMTSLIFSIVNAVLSPFVFALLDRLRKRI